MPETVPAAIDKNQDFSRERDAYVILRLPFSAYRPSARELPEGYRLGSGPLDRKQRNRERQLLEIRHRQDPYNGKLAGFRADSPVFVFAGDELVGGLYACDQHEFERNRRWGQIHYFFLDPAHREKGLETALLSEAVGRVRSWGLDGVYISTDLGGLPETYQRSGAELWKEIPRTNGASRHPQSKPWNWLVHRIEERAIWEVLRRYASGVLVDIGCGVKPAAAMTVGMVTRHIGVDFMGSLHGLGAVDVIADAYHTTLPNETADTVLCTNVLEHLERPQDALDEMFRILKPGGYVLLSAPLFWHLHEEPRDFFRFTKHGWRHLFETSGFEVVEVTALSGFIVTFCQEFCYFLEALPFRVPGILLYVTEYAVQLFAWKCHQHNLDRMEAFTFQYTAVGRKPDRDAG